ncbi:drug/metabolite transporter (DMT)-like permease [Algoriphagus iocasae]|uniref:Drug/metabolite transporter (DMT)-like permease n=2 Tax=Algoriphagus iocasae TaxID=1836499 RepID=A0A841N1F3_9BACT|nr:drug/metabolite transporter (DMT)-like permease [Algoriphagus iocasae]
MKISSVQSMILAGIFFALMNVSVKYVPHIPAIEIILFRSLFSLVFSYSVLKRQNVKVFGNNKKLLVLRGVVGSVGLISFFYTLQKIPLASAVTLQYLSPILTTILGIFLVREKVKPIQFLFFGISFLGVVLVQGFDTRVNLLYASIGFISALFSGLAYNVIRKLKNTEHPLVIIFYFPLVTLPIAILISFFTWVQPEGWDWGILLWIGICTQTAQYFMTVAYQNANVSKISSLSYLGVFYALIFGFFFFGEAYTLMAYVGMALLLLGVVLNYRVKNPA